MLTLSVMPNFKGTLKERLQALAITLSIDTAIFLACIYI